MCSSWLRFVIIIGNDGKWFKFRSIVLLLWYFCFWLWYYPLDSLCMVFVLLLQEFLELLRDLDECNDEELMKLLILAWNYFC